MDIEELLRLAASDDIPEEERVNAIQQLPVTDRRAVALFSILSESLQPAIRHQAQVALREAASAFCKRLTGMFHIIPWDARIMEAEEFSRIYERTVQITDHFRDITPEKLTAALTRYPRSLMVFRLIAGYQWGELSAILEAEGNVTVSAATLQRIERAEDSRRLTRPLMARLPAIGRALYDLIAGNIMGLPPNVSPTEFKTRLYKVDTRAGWTSVAQAANRPLSLADLLYERYTGRPFAYVRDALSEKKADLLEEALEQFFQAQRIPYQRIRDNRAKGFIQAPDFLLPNEDTPRVAVEAKLAEDGGTARDKAARIERLSYVTWPRGITLVAVVDGKGFKRLNDVFLPILKHTHGLTFFSTTIDELLSLPEIQALVPSARPSR